MTGLREYKIYVLADPDTRRVRYVGRTRGDLIDRLAEHIGEASSRSTSGTKFTDAKKIWIRGLLKKGKAPIVEVVQDVDSLEAAKCAEYFWLVFYRACGANLTNNNGYFPPDAVNVLGITSDNEISRKWKVGRKTVRLMRKCFVSKKKLPEELDDRPRVDTVHANAKQNLVVPA